MLDLPQVIVGASLLIVGTAPIVWLAVSVRSHLLPGATFACARLAEIVVSLAAVLMTSQVLGAVGLFRRGPLVVACAAVGFVGGLIARSVSTPLRPQAKPARTSSSFATLDIAVLAATGLVLITTWAIAAGPALNRGIVSYDSVWYHLPVAARFVQTGWLTRLHFTVPEFPDAQHPANAEVIHGIGMAFFGTDAISPLINLAWLALALLAAWRIGERAGFAPAVVAASALAFSTPILARDSGQATNDTAVLFFLLAMVAFLPNEFGGLGAQHSREFFASLVLGAVAAGCAVGTKLYAIAPVSIVTIGVVLLSRRNLRVGTYWGLPLAATGSYWYLRNLFRTGSPLSSVRVGIGPVAFPKGRFFFVDEWGHSAATYAFDIRIWRHSFIPDLERALGPAWWLTALLSLTGVVLLVVAGRSQRSRVVGIAAIVTLLVWFFMPTTAFGAKGQPWLFGVNIRYAAPAALAGLIYLPLATRRLGLPWYRLTLLAILLLAVVQQWGAYSAWHSRSMRGYAGASVFVFVGVVLVLLVGARATPALMRVPMTMVLISIAAPLIGHLADQHVAYRYAGYPLARWAESVSGSRLAVTTQQQYQLYDVHLKNHVEYLGVPGPHGAFHWITRCATWRARLRNGRYDYVVLARSGTDPTSRATTAREISWTRSDPAAREIAGDFRTPVGEPVLVFDFDPRVRDPGCS